MYEQHTRLTPPIRFVRKGLVGFGVQVLTCPVTLGKAFSFSGPRPLICSMRVLIPLWANLVLDYYQ